METSTADSTEVAGDPGSSTATVIVSIIQSVSSSQSATVSQSVSSSQSATISQSVSSSQSATESVAKKSLRRAYSKEKKLAVLQYYHKCNCNKYKTCQKFGIAKPSLIRWIKSEELIRKGKKGAKRIGGGGRRPFWPDVEEKLVSEFKELRQKGLKVRHYWFATRSKQLMAELHPGVEFKFSQGWFDRFKARNKISLRRTTTVALLT